MKDYYKILEIHPDASLEVMNNAYRTLVRKYHPDLYHTSHKGRMNEKMQEINEAYNILSTTHSRMEYDRRYRTRQTNASSKPPLQPIRLKHILLWGLGTYVVLKFLLLPLLTHPFLRMLLLVGILYLAFRFIKRSRSQ